MFKFFKNNSIFYSKTHPLLHLFAHTFIKGDIILLPFVLLIFSLIFFSVKFMLISYGVFLTIRYFSEIIYWLFQQFGTKNYRPYDFGLKKLDNNAIYIIYQLISIIWTCLGIMLVIFVLQYL